MNWDGPLLVLLFAASVVLYVAVAVRLIALEIAWEEGMPDLKGVGLYLIAAFALVRGRRRNAHWRRHP